MFPLFSFTRTLAKEVYINQVDEAHRHPEDSLHSPKLCPLKVTAGAPNSYR